MEKTRYFAVVVFIVKACTIYKVESILGLSFDGLFIYLCIRSNPLTTSSKYQTKHCAKQ